MHALIGGRFEGQLAIKLKPEAHARFAASIKRFVAETLDEAELGHWNRR